MAETKDQNSETYTASPNQIVYDQEHQMDFEVNVTMAKMDSWRKILEKQKPLLAN